MARNCSDNSCTSPGSMLAAHRLPDKPEAAERKPGAEGRKPEAAAERQRRLMA